jgi:hypothetical protein
MEDTNCESESIQSIEGSPSTPLPIETPKTPTAHRLRPTLVRRIYNLSIQIQFTGRMN